MSSPMGVPWSIFCVSRIVSSPYIRQDLAQKMLPLSQHHSHVFCLRSAFLDKIILRFTPRSHGPHPERLLVQYLKHGTPSWCPGAEEQQEIGQCRALGQSCKIKR